MAHDIEIDAKDLGSPAFLYLSEKEKHQAIDKARGILRVEARAWEEYFEKLEIQAMMSENRENLEIEIAQLKWLVKILCKRLAVRKAASELHKEKMRKKERKSYYGSEINAWM